MMLKRGLNSFLVMILIFGLAGNLSAGQVNARSDSTSGQQNGIQLEYLDRGLVAAPTSEGVFLSWRLLANEVTGHSDNGLTGADFHVYRDDEKIATVTDSTNFLDEKGEETSEY